MKIGLIAIAGVKMQTRKFIEMGVTLPQFMNRGRVVAQLPSLALLTLAGITPPDVDVEYIEVDDVVAFAENPRTDFDFVALSTYTARAFDAYLVADAFRERGVPVVFGGLHATVMPDEVALHADAVAVGEGELLWPRIVHDFRKGGKAGWTQFYREAEPGLLQLSSHYEMPRYDLLTSDTGPGNVPDPLASGEIHRLGAYNRITVQTTRGCPLDCEFCAASKLYGPRYRIKPIDRVLQEIDAVRALWKRPFIEFADDNTFVNKKWAKNLLRELIPRDIRYFTETDVSIADDDELLDLLYPSGCRQVLIGFESPRKGSVQGIDRNNWKASRHDKYLECIQKIQSRGVSVCGCFIVGLDNDTPDVFDEIRAFVDKAKLLEVQITVLTAFPGTRLYDRLLAENRLLYPGAWDRCTLFDVSFKPKHMSVEQLEDGVLELWRDTWNAQSLAARKLHYRQLLRARRNAQSTVGEALISDSPLPTMTNPVAFGDTDPGEEADEYYALPSH